LKSCGIYNTEEYQPRFDIFEIVAKKGNPSAFIRYSHIAAAYDTGDLHVFV
jgi:hypothetical protein